MPSPSFPAHYDGKHILLDVPTDLPIGGRLLVTVLDDDDSSKPDFQRLAEQGLARAYGEGEPEYSEADLRP